MAEQVAETSASEPQAQAPSQTKQRVVAIAVDGSGECQDAFQFYLRNVRKENDKVVLIHSVEVNDVLHATQWYNTPYSFDKNVLMQLLDDEREKIKHKLEGFAKFLRDAGIDGTVKSIHAESPGSGICRAAEEINADFIVVGSRGLGKLRRTFMGSVSDYVIHHSTTPVLVCRHESHGHDHGGKHDGKHEGKKH